MTTSKGELYGKENYDACSNSRRNRDIAGSRRCLVRHGKPWRGGDENYTVSFVDGDNELSTLDVKDNSLVKQPADPVKDGYIFAGWYADSALTKTFDFKNTKITENTTIYAKFVSKDDKFTVSFNTDGGSSVASQTVNAGEKVTKPADPTKANNVFAGWYCDANLTEAYDFNAPVLSDLTLYAKWTAASGTYTVTFNTNGGSAVPSQTVKAGEQAVKPANPTKANSNFAGWYTDAQLTTQYNFNSPVNANITLYAKWTSTGGGGGGGPVTPEKKPVEITVSENTAEIIVNDADKLAEEAKDGTVSISIPEGETVNNVSLSAESLTSLNTVLENPEVSNVELETSSVNISLDTETLKTIISASDGEGIVISSNDVTNKLDNQIIKDKVGSNPVYELSITTTSGNKIDLSANTGEIVFTIPADNVTDPWTYSVYYISDDGNTIELVGTYDAASGLYIAKTSHFSYYALINGLPSAQGTITSTQSPYSGEYVFSDSYTDKKYNDYIIDFLLTVDNTGFTLDFKGDTYDGDGKVTGVKLSKPSFTVEKNQYYLSEIYDDSGYNTLFTASNIYAKAAGGKAVATVSNVSGLDQPTTVTLKMVMYKIVENSKTDEITISNVLTYTVTPVSGGA